MHTQQPTSIIHNLIQHILQQTQQMIAELAFKTTIIQSLVRQTNSTLYQTLQHNNLDLPEKSVQMIQQQLDRVPHIHKDCLMPREVSSDKTPQMSQMLPQKTRTTLGFKKTRSKMTDLSKSQHTSLHLSKLGQQSQSPKASSKIDKKIAQSKPTPLDNYQQQISQQQIQLRGKYQIDLRYQSQFKKMALERSLTLKKHQQHVQQLTQGNPQIPITQHYDHQFLTSSIPTDKIQTYNVRTSIGEGKRRLKQFYANMATLEQTIKLSRYKKEKSLTISQIKPMMAPPLQAPRSIISTNPIRQYKLKEYNKHFGHRYSRFDNHSLTIDHSVEEDNDELFSQRKCIRDSTTVLLDSSKTSLGSSIHRRRLALPRIKGKYSTLDRYQLA